MPPLIDLRSGIFISQFQLGTLCKLVPCHSEYLSFSGNGNFAILNTKPLDIGGWCFQAPVIIQSPGISFSLLENFV